MLHCSLPTPRSSGASAFLPLAAVCLTVLGCMDPEAPGNLVPGTVDDDPDLPSFEANGTKFHLETLGDPTHPPIVVLHGGPGHDYRCMLSLAETYGGYSLADDYYFVFWDQRGAGLSRRHSQASDFSFDIYLKDLEAVVDRYAGTRDVILIGHSWGGGYAAMYMNAHPERIAGAALLEPIPLSTALDKYMGDYHTTIFSEWTDDWIWFRQLVGQNDHETADYAMAQAFTTEWADYRHESLHPWWREGAAVHLFMDPVIEQHDYDFTENLHLVMPEVLFIASENTEDLGITLQEPQRRVFPRSRLEVVPNAGHYDIVWKEAEKTVAFIRTYLASLDLEG